jgi:hypothetical protein
MHPICKATAIAVITISATDAFVTDPAARTQLPSTRAASLIRLPNHLPHLTSSARSSTQLYATADDDAQDNQIERLKKMAAKLRAEAASLEANKAKQLADAAENAFRRFDIDLDGEISLNELKMGLEKELKVCPPESNIGYSIVPNVRSLMFLPCFALNTPFRLKFPKRE